MSVALPSYTILISKKTHEGVLIKHNVLLSPSNQLHPYPKNTWPNICEASPPTKKIGEDTMNQGKQAQPTTQTLNLPQLFIPSTFSCSDTSRLISHIWLEHKQKYTRLHHKLLEKHDPKNAHFEAKTQKRRTTGRGSAPQRQKHCTPIPSTRPHYPLSNTFFLICSAFLTATWFSHTMVPKTQHLPSPARDTDK